MADAASARGTLLVRLHGATGLRATDHGGTSDTYVKLKICGTEHRSKSIPNTLAPTWDERFDFSGTLAEFRDDALALTVHDKDGALGGAYVDLSAW